MIISICCVVERRHLY